jgi:hypothetical protein
MTDPIVDSDDVIAEALADVSVPALIASVVGLTGDPAFVRGPIKPRRFVQNEFQGLLDDEEKAQLRSDALAAICSWRDAACPPPAQLSIEVMREVMDWIACEPVPPDNAALYAEEMDLGGENPRAIALDDTVTVPPGFSVLIIGFGASGLLAAIRLKEAGIPFEIVEKNNDVGGTWYENSYPGCRVDVASHYYSYSFEPNNDFAEYYTQQGELHDYFRKVMARNRCTDPLGVRGAVCAVGRRHRPMGRHGAQDGRTRGDDHGQRRDLGGGYSQPTVDSRLARLAAVHRPGVPLCALGSLGGSQWQTDRIDRRRRQRLSDWTRDRRRGQEPGDLSTDPPVDGPESPLPRGGHAGRALGDAAPPRLRPVVSIHADVAVQRQTARIGPCGF